MNTPYLRYGRRVWTSLEKVIARGHPKHEVFTDWIDLMLDAYLSLTDNFARKGKNDPDDLDGPYEDRYAATAARYDRKDMLALVQAYLDLAVGVERQGSDVLGEIYTTCIRPGHAKYFTPQRAAEHVSQLGLRVGMCVHDPCCGSGTMLIEAGKVADVELLGEDSDPVCARMCALNLVLFHFRGQVREGNSLKFVREWRIAKGHLSEHGRGDEEARDQGAAELAPERSSGRRGSDTPHPRETRLHGEQAPGDEVVAPVLLGGRRELAHTAARR